MTKESTKYRLRDLDPISEFSASFRYVDPSEEYAEQRCREIEQENELLTPLYRYRVKIEELKVEEIVDRKFASWYKMNWKYSFGRASLYSSPISLLDHFLGVRVDQFSLEQDQGSNILDHLIDSTTGKFSGASSSGYRLLHTIVAGLSIYRRLQMIQETTMRLTNCDSLSSNIMNEEYGQSSHSTTHQFLNILIHLVRETIYQDLKRELAFSENCFYRLEQLCSITQSVDHNNLTSNKEVISAIVYIFCKLERSSYWRSWVPGMLASLVESMKEKREMLTLLKDSCLSILHSRMSSMTAFDELVAKATLDAEQRSDDATAEIDDSLHGIAKTRWVYSYLIE